MSQWRQLGRIAGCLWWVLVAQASLADDRAWQRCLPQEAIVKEALISSPAHQAAWAQKEGAWARAQGIAAGSAEFTVRGTTQQRRDGRAGVALHESMVTLERPVRMWGKQAIDANLATATRALADVVYADALHESARELMDFWFAYLRALADRHSAAAALAWALKMQKLTEIQFRQGEISRLDADLAQAELERTRAAHEVSLAQVDSAVATLTRRYPRLALPDALPEALNFKADAAPLRMTESMAASQLRFLTKNHELNMLRMDAERQRWLADRVLRERWPDPTLGVYSGRERAGAESVAGVLLSMPLPGVWREQQARVAVAEAQSAADKVQLAEQRLSAMFESTWLQFERKQSAADSLRSAAQRQALAADKSAKAYALGEGSLAEVLWIARTASDNLIAAQRMQLEVVALWALIQLDLHQLWDFDE